MKNKKIRKIIEHLYPNLISKCNLDNLTSHLKMFLQTVIIFAEKSYKIQYMNCSSFHTITLDMPVSLWKACHSYDYLETFCLSLKKMIAFWWFLLPPVSGFLFLKYILSNNAIIKKEHFRDDSKNTSDEIVTGFIIFIKTVIITLALIVAIGVFYSCPCQ